MKSETTDKLISNKVVESLWKFDSIHNGVQKYLQSYIQEKFEKRKTGDSSDKALN